MTNSTPSQPPVVEVRDICGEKIVDVTINGKLHTFGFYDEAEDYREAACLVGLRGEHGEIPRSLAEESAWDIANKAMYEAMFGNESHRSSVPKAPALK